MAAELITPTDPLTGMPLPIALPEDQYVAPEQLNWHHHFHPSTAPELSSLGGKALRSARVQLVPAEIHNLGKDTYHGIFRGPVLPQAEDAQRQFMLCVLACAGYVPQQAIDVRSDDPSIPVVLTDAQMQRQRTLATPLRISRGEVLRLINKSEEGISPKEAWRTLDIRRKRQASFSYERFRYSYEPIREFFRDFLLQQEIDINPRVIKRFLKATDLEKRQALGDTILSQVADQSTTEFRQIYKSLHASGELHPRMPEGADRLVFRKLGNFAQRARLMPQLQEQLRPLVE